MRYIMILYRHGAVILLQLLAMSVVVKSHVCLLKKRPDPSHGGTLRWSLLYKELCFCQRVLAPRFISQGTCPIKEESCPDGFACNLWFVDDPTQLTQRQNWNTDKLDVLLERAIYCKEATKAETEGASSSQKTDAIEASTFADHDETTQAKTEGGSSSQKTAAVETSTSADQEETTQAETEGGSLSQKTDAVEASTSDDQEKTTQAETADAILSRKSDAVEASTSADQENTTQATTETIVTSKTGPECDSIPLGMESGAIPDSHIEASSFVTSPDWDREPKYARLGLAKFWAVDSVKDLASWIRVFLGSSYRVTGLQTESVFGTVTRWWVKTITVKVGSSGNSLKFIEDDDEVPKVFNASYSRPNEVVNVTLNSNGILTTFVEIHPTNCWQEKRGVQIESPFCVLRFEILGCSEF